MFIPYTTLTVATICLVLFFTLTPIFDFTWLMLLGQKLYWWAPITCQYLHLSARHITSNLIVLLPVGALVEKHIGAWRTLLFINISGILAGLWWYLSHINTDTYLMGSSGFVYALVSFCFLYILPGKKRWVYYIALAALTVMAITQPIYKYTVDPQAAWEPHVMGIFVGFLYAAYLHTKNRNQVL